MRQPVGDGSDHAATVDIEGRKFDVTRLLGEIDLDNLSAEVQQAGGHVIWYGVLHARALSQQRRARASLETTKAVVARQIRVKRASLSEKVTDKAVEEEVMIDERVRAADDALITAEESTNIMRATCTALEEKQRQLRALSNMTVRELNASESGDPLRGEMRAQAATMRAGRHERG